MYEFIVVRLLLSFGVPSLPGIPQKVTKPPCTASQSPQVSFNRLIFETVATHTRDSQASVLWGDKPLKIIFKWVPVL